MRVGTWHCKLFRRIYYKLSITIIEHDPFGQAYSVSSMNRVLDGADKGFARASLIKTVFKSVSFYTKRTSYVTFFTYLTI